MGDPKKQRKKYSTPSHPWQKERIDEEKELLKDYGLKNKKEIWKIDSKLKNFFLQVKKLVASSTKQSEIERQQLLSKLLSLGLIKKESRLEDVLNIKLKDLLERRLQTLVHRKNLSKSVKQSRQFITHRHITVKERTITAPSYLVSTEEEAFISFNPSSDFSNPDHPERIVQEPKKPKKKKTKEKQNETK